MRNISFFKSIQYLSKISVLLLLLVCSCSDEVSDSSSESKYHETKTCEFKINDYQSLGIDITDGEAISVFSTDVPDENRKFQFKEMTFSGEIATTGDYYGVYPYKATSSFSYESETPIAHIDVPLTNIANVTSGNSEQVVDYTNGTASDIAIAKLSDETVKFNTIFTQLSFTVDAEYDYHIDKIEVKGLNGEKLTGYSNISVASVEPIIEFTDKSNTKALYDCDVTINKGERITISLPIVPANFENGFVVVLYNGTSPTEKEYTSLQLKYGSINSIDGFELKLPEYFVEYKADVEIILPGYLSEFENGTGKIYLSSNKIPDNMFKGQLDLKEVNIPYNIVSIGNNAFAGTENLSVVNIGDVKFSYDPNNQDLITGVSTNSVLEFIGNNSFDKCNASVYVLPETIKDISNAFASVATSFKVYILATVPPLMSSNAFSSSMTSLYVPEQSIEAYHAKYPSLKDKTVAIGDDEVVGKYYVKYTSNTALDKVVEGYRHEYDQSTQTGYIYFDTPEVPDKLFFQKGESVKSITLSAAIEKIGSQSFRLIGNRVGLLSFNVEAGSKLKEIGFMGVQANENCIFDFSNAKMLEVIGQISFGECYAIMSYNFPNSVKKIEMGAFRNIQWKEVTLNEGVETLVGNQWNGVFQGCTSMTKLVLPSTLNDIGLNGLKMPHLSNSPSYIVVCNAVTPPTVVVEKSQFLSTGSLKSKVKAIYVPASSIEEYKSAAGWSDFNDRIKSVSELNN